MWGLLATLGMGTLLPCVLLPWLRRDILQVYRQVWALLQYRWLVIRRIFPTDALERNAMKQPKKTFIIFQDNEYSYQYMNEQVNRMAHIAVEKLGLKKGDVVALLCHNEPAFIWTFYGLLKVGVQVAFLNFNLRSQSLLHCFKVSGARSLFLGQGEELMQAIEGIADQLGPNVTIYTQGHSNVPAGYKRIDDLLVEASVTNMDKRYSSQKRFSDTACYIYTSGTTGLPKAAVITNLKMLKAGCLMRFFNIRSDDIIYTPLPLYHSAASMIALGNTVLKGATIVIRSKFSASQFWDDCCRHHVTIIQYIGELCRYLVNTTVKPQEQKHKVRLAVGNGLRQDVWVEFQQRFKIPVIGEFYAATEGNSGFVNVLNIPGSVGRLSPIMRKIFPVHFIKYDFSTAEPLRNEKGLCETVPFGEPGLMVAPIMHNFEYDGYKGNKDLSQQKVLRNVFKPGDCYYNSGDLFTQDADYNVYFSDRIGDTFRWKGENVSTIEVSNVLTTSQLVQDANVYGVEVPENDGRAGMATLTLTEGGSSLTKESLCELYETCVNNLPLYAIPRFIRVVKEMKMTSTYKQLKTDLVKDGFDPARSNGDPLFYADFSGKTYTSLDTTTYEQIVNGNIKL